LFFNLEPFPVKDHNYPLGTLDSGTTIHIFNEISRFTNFRTANPGDFVWVGMEKVPIQGYGTIDIMVTGSENNRKRTSKKILPIQNVAYCQDSGLHHQLGISQLRKRGMW
jgi:hypothetical protein